MGPFEGNFIPLNGGLGVSLSCTGTSTSAAFPTLSNGVRAELLAITNCGTDMAFVALGTSTVTATTACLAIPPGTYFIQLPNTRGAGAPTYIAGITGGTAVTVQASLGNTVSG